MYLRFRSLKLNNYKGLPLLVEVNMEQECKWLIQILLMEVLETLVTILVQLHQQDLDRLQLRSPQLPLRLLVIRLEL